MAKKNNNLKQYARHKAQRTIDAIPTGVLIYKNNEQYLDSMIRLMDVYRKRGITGYYLDTLKHEYDCAVRIIKQG
jgi:hypothetical protein